MSDVDDKGPGLLRQRQSATLQRAFFDLFFILSFLYITYRIARDFRSGGDAWGQADWLISNLAGDVRRGQFGSAIISIGDYLGTSPLLVVSAIQVILLALLFLCYRSLALRSMGLPLAILLSVSSAIFAVFWVADPQGAVRKELLTFSGLALCALGALRGVRPLFWLGTLLVGVSFIAHEALVLFIPTFVLIIWITSFHRAAPRQSVMAIAAVSLAGVYAVVYALLNAQVDDPGAVCAPLLLRGLDEGICGGAIKWLGYDMDRAQRVILSQLTAGNLFGFSAAYAAALCPLAYCISLSADWRVPAVFLLLLAVPFLPLFFIAVDWGRWMSFHVFSASILLACAVEKGKVLMARKPMVAPIAMLVVISLLISPEHRIAAIWGGAIRQAAGVLWRQVVG